MAINNRELIREVPLDDEWFKRFKEIGNFQAYEYLGDDEAVRNEQKRQFLAGEVRNPTLKYPQLEKWLQGEKTPGEKSIPDHTKREKDLLTLKKDIEQTDTSKNDKLDIAKRVYIWRINEKIAELRMMKAIAKGDMTSFNRYTGFVYGVPNKDVLKYTLGVIDDKISKKTDDPDLLAAQAALKALLPDTKSIPGEDPLEAVSPIQPVVKTQVLRIVAPTPTMIAEAAGPIWNNMGVLKQLIERTRARDKEQLEAQEIKNIFDASLMLLEAESEWTVVITTDSKTSVSVNQEKQLVQIPATRKASAKKIAGLIAHEIGTHVQRRRKGERTSLKLLSLGLDRYEGGEEGVAGQAEKITAGEEIKDFTGLEYHLAISLAKGLDRNTEKENSGRDFKEVFDILYHYFIVQKMTEHKKKMTELEKNIAQAKSEFDSFTYTESPDLQLYLAARENLIKAQRALAKEESLESKAQDAAWRICIRVFRGSDGQTPGVCFTKDIIYREGQIGVWDLLNTNKDEMVRFTVGKYSPTDPRHLWVLNTLGISDQDLADWE